jgi:hypothetical protein
MQELLERLGRGDAHIMAMCQEANRVWTDFLEELRGADTGTLAARLGFFQPTFARIFGSESFGNNMMPWTGFAALYDTRSGWGANLERAKQLAEAFARSNCSAQVKSEARSCVISYELEGHVLAPSPSAPVPEPQQQKKRRW